MEHELSSESWKLVPRFRIIGGGVGIEAEIFPKYVRYLSETASSTFLGVSRIPK